MTYASTPHLGAARTWCNGQNRCGAGRRACLGQQHIARVAVQRGHQVPPAAAVRSPECCGTGVRNGFIYPITLNPVTALALPDGARAPENVEGACTLRADIQYIHMHMTLQ